MADEGKYKETKERQCICCGKIVTVTKFMSDKVVKCDKCKESGAQPNPDILATVQGKKNSEPIATKSTGNTKILPCIICGKDVEVTKFASASKVMCDDCKVKHGKSTASSDDNSELPEIVVDMSKLDRNAIPSIESYMTTPSLIANPALREVVCPACGHKHMKIIKIVDWSIFGVIAEYQCPECRLLIKVSEQTTHMITYHGQSALFDYSGNQIEKLMSATDSTRLHTAIRQLMKKLDENNITIDGIELPPYPYENHRPVPVGYVIPQTDRNIKIVDDVIHVLEKSKRVNDVGEIITDTVDDIPEGTKCIIISDTLALKLANDLKQLFKEDINNENEEY